MRIALGPAVMETASIGRTRDCTRPVCTNLKKTLAKREPSTHDPKRKWAMLLNPTSVGARQHFDEVFVSISGKHMYLWRAVDKQGLC